MPHDTLPLPFLLRVGSDYGVLAGPETSSDAIFKSLSHRQYFLAFFLKHWPIALEGGGGEFTHFYLFQHDFLSSSNLLPFLLM